MLIFPALYRMLNAKQIEYYAHILRAIIKKNSLAACGLRPGPVKTRVINGQCGLRLSHCMSQWIALNFRILDD